MILVTGGAGFIGSNIVEALEREERGPIVVCDTLGVDNKWRNISKRTLHDWINPEILFEYLEDFGDQITGVIHMGAISSTTVTDGDLVMGTNFLLSLDLMKWCAEASIPFIYASSAATYGDGAGGFVDNEDFDHLRALTPLNLYGWSKNHFDQRVIQGINLKEKMPPQWAGLKFFNVYGPNEYHKGAQQSVVSHIYSQIKQGNHAKLFKSYKPEYPHGGQLRDFIWVGDCVKVVLWLLDNPNVSGIFNVGTGQARSFEDLAKSVYRALGEKPDIKYIDMPESLKDKYQYFTQASMDKLRSKGYDFPMTSLEDGVQKYIQNYLAAQDCYI
jgi:ADP-L-glycero-D-manno-heptose 6-epimerase